jgi:hypothetical protein
MLLLIDEEIVRRGVVQKVIGQSSEQIVYLSVPHSSKLPYVSYVGQGCVVLHDYVILSKVFFSFSL